MRKDEAEALIEEAQQDRRIKGTGRPDRAARQTGAHFLYSRPGRTAQPARGYHVGCDQARCGPGQATANARECCAMMLRIDIPVFVSIENRVYAGVILHINGETIVVRVWMGRLLEVSVHVSNVVPREG